MSNVAPVASLWGSPANAHTSVQPPGTTVQVGGMPFIGHEKCAANHGQCGAPRAKGTELCIGHLRSLEKQQAAERAHAGVSDEQG
jgi:hypothetical protein